ncbi:MAG: hypothetical protein AB8B87_03855 [Granulosicoccus sp.]
MSNTNCISIQELDALQTSPENGHSSASASNRPRPVLVSNQPLSSVQDSQLSREEALRQAIMRTG